MDWVRFVINMNWLLNLDQIIDHRIAAQNAGQLIAFSARVFFDDGRITTLPDHDSFLAFRDLSQAISVGVDIKWTYLISFPGKDVPEKQEIRFYAFTDKDVQIERTTKRSRSFFLSDEDREELYFSILFSDLTWGEDMNNHMSNYILTNTRRRGGVSKFIAGLSSAALFPIMFTLGMFATLFVDQTGSRNAYSALIAKYNLDGNYELEMPNMADKLRYLVDGSVTELFQRTAASLFVVKMILILLFVSGLIFIIRTRKASFMYLNDHSEAYYNKYSHYYELIKIGISLALIIGVIGGIFANTIYDYLKHALWG
jgi:hypothetical protein